MAISSTRYLAKSLQLRKQNVSWRGHGKMSEEWAVGDTTDDACVVGQDSMHHGKKAAAV